MAKVPHLTEVEKFFIEGNYKVLSASEIAQKLGRSLNSVKNHIAKIKAKTTENVVTSDEVETTTDTVENQQQNSDVTTKLTVDKLMGENKRYGSRVMTPAASQLVDDLKKVNKPKRFNDSCTFKIKKDK